jgi:hypothetical protein
MDVVVAGEGIGLEVLRAVLDPLDRPPEGERGDDRDDVARVDRDLAAEAPADVMGLDSDLRFGDARDEADDGAVDVRSLAGDVEVEMLADRVPVGDAAAGLDRGDVDPGDVDIDGDDPVRCRQRRVSGLAIARLPVPAWYMTVSVGRTICLSPARVGIQWSPAASRSLPVMTASTPGMASAADVSMDRILAWA